MNHKENLDTECPKRLESLFDMNTMSRWNRLRKELLVYHSHPFDTLYPTFSEERILIFNLNRRTPGVCTLFQNKKKPIVYCTDMLIEVWMFELTHGESLAYYRYGHGGCYVHYHLSLIKTWKVSDEIVRDDTEQSFVLRKRQPTCWQNRNGNTV